MSNVIFFPAKSLLAFNDDNPDKQTFLNYAKKHGWNLQQIHFNSNYLFGLQKGSREILFSGEAYNATGYEPFYFNLPQNVDLINIHPNRTAVQAYAPKNVPLAAIMERCSSQLIVYAEKTQITLEQKVLLIPFEVLCFHPMHEKWLTEYMESKHAGFKLSDNFFENLKLRISNLEDTPNERACFELIMEIYRKTYADSYSMCKLEHFFENVLKNIFDTRKQDAHDRYKRLAISNSFIKDETEKNTTPINPILTTYQQDYAKLEASATFKNSLFNNQKNEYKENRQKGQSTSTDNTLANPSAKSFHKQGGHFK